MTMKFSLRGVTVRIHPLLPCLWAISFLWYGGKTLPMLCALAAHEAGHICFALLFHMQVDEMEITPFGGVISIRHMDAAPSGQAFLVAAGGPVFSLLCCICAPWLARVWSFSQVHAFACASLLLFLVNLIPALPLDGGRMLRAILTRFISFRTANRLLVRAGYAVGMLLCALSLFFAFRGIVQLYPAFAGLYLLYAAAQEARESGARYISSLISRRQKIQYNQALPVEILAIGAEMPVYQLIRSLHPGKYHMVYVLSRDGMKKTAVLDDAAIYEAAIRGMENSVGNAVHC